MNTLRVWLIHRLGGVDKPLPTTLPGYPAAYTTSSSGSGYATFVTTWTAPPVTKRWWQ
jgi:hypothetical protein